MNKAQCRYSDFINSDCNLSFAERLGITIPECVNYGDFSNPKYVYSRFKNGFSIAGEPCKTMKEAKASYKSVLNEYLKNRQKSRIMEDRFY